MGRAVQGDPGRGLHRRRDRPVHARQGLRGRLGAGAHRRAAADVQADDGRPRPRLRRPALALHAAARRPPLHHARRRVAREVRRLPPRPHRLLGRRRRHLPHLRLARPALDDRRRERGGGEGLPRRGPRRRRRPRRRARAGGPPRAPLARPDRRRHPHGRGGGDCQRGRTSGGHQRHVRLPQLRGRDRAAAGRDRDVLPLHQAHPGAGDGRGGTSAPATPSTTSSPPSSSSRTWATTGGSRWRSSTSSPPTRSSPTSRWRS